MSTPFDFVLLFCAVIGGCVIIFVVLNVKFIINRIRAYFYAHTMRLIMMEHDITYVQKYNAAIRNVEIPRHWQRFFKYRLAIPNMLPQYKFKDRIVIHPLYNPCRVDEIIQSGVIPPVIFGRNGFVIANAESYLAAKRLGLKYIDVYVSEYYTHPINQLWNSF